MGSSVRVIKIVKDPYTKEEAYTLEFECEADDSKALMSELTKSPLGERLIELLNQADFLPKEQQITAEELKKQAEEEEADRKKHEDRLKKKAREDTLEKVYDELKDNPKLKRFFESIGNFESFCKMFEKKEKKSNKEDTVDDGHDSVIGISGLG